MKTPPAPVGAGHRHCFTCGTTKPLSEFFRQNREGRPQTHAHWCKGCQKAYYQQPKWKAFFIKRQREMRNAKRDAMMARKVAEGCADCGENHPACLEYHHIDPTQKVTEISKLIASNASMKRIETEAAKCEVLCSNCHRKRHYMDGTNSRTAV